MGPELELGVDSLGLPIVGDVVDVDAVFGVDSFFFFEARFVFFSFINAIAHEGSCFQFTIRCGDRQPSQAEGSQDEEAGDGCDQVEDG